MRSFSFKRKIKPLLFFLLLSIVFGLYLSGAHENLSFDNIKQNLGAIILEYQDKPFLFTSVFILGYVLLTALSIPGAIVLTILSGAIYGVFLGTLIVSIASCIGATIAFFMSRYFFRDYFLTKYRKRFKEIDEKFKAGGKTYLFTMRLIPVSPFVVINLLMGLTSIRVSTYVWITLLGMIPGTMIYVFAGRRMAEIRSPRDILDWPLLVAFSLIGLLPLMLKFFTKGRKWEHAHDS